MNRRRVVGLGWCFAAVMACDQRSPTAIPGGLNVPFPIGDPVVELPARTVLSRSEWVYVGGVAPTEPAFTQRWRLPGAAAFGGAVTREGEPQRYAQTRNLAISTASTPTSDTIEVDPGLLAAAGFTPPGRHVWLVGAGPPCRSQIGMPRLAIDDASVEVFWELRECPGADWAPLGVLAETVAENLRFVAATSLVHQWLGPQERWEHPLTHIVQTPSWSPPGPVEVALWVRSVEGLDPTPVEILWTEIAATAPAPACASLEATAVVHAWWSDAGIETLAPLDATTTEPLLLGAFSQDGRSEALVYSDGGHAAVAIAPWAPPGEQADRDDAADRRPDPPPWRTIAIPTRADDPIAFEVGLPGCER